MRTTLDVKNIQTQLKEKRAVILSRIHMKQKNQSRTAARPNPDRSDLAQDYFLEERQSALVAHMEETLEQLDAALQRIDEGVYGRCTRCGKNISPQRLEALPYPELCITCKEQSQEEPDRR